MPILTKRKIDSTNPKAGKEVVVLDDDPRGFGVRVRPTGVKTFFVLFTSPSTGRRTRFTIGQYGRLTVDEARSEARKVLGQVELGMDPAQQKRQAKMTVRDTAQTVSAVCDDYLRDAREGLVTYRGRPKKPSTLDTDEGRIKRHIRPLLGEKLVKNVTPADVKTFMHDVRLGKTAVTVKTGPRGVARVTGGPGTARRTVGLLGSIFTYAIEHGLRADNPVAGIEKAPDRKRDRVLSPDEYRRLGDALGDFGDSAVNPIAVQAIQALALTGCRKGEIYGLRHAEIDAHNCCLRLEDTKTGQEVRAIGRAALAVLVVMPVSQDRPFVFPAHRGNGHLTDVKVFKKACEKAGLEGVTLHVLRHSFASTALELEYSELTIAGLLGHRSHSVTSRYAHHIDRALAAAADRVSALIAARMAGREADGADVVELHGAR